MPYMSISVLSPSSYAKHLLLNPIRYIIPKPVFSMVILGGLLSFSAQAQADSISALIMEKSAQPELTVPAARVSTRSTIQRVRMVSPANTDIYPAQNHQSQVKQAQSYRPQTPQVKSSQIPSSQPRAIYASSNNTASRYTEPKRQTPRVLPEFLSGGSISGSYDNVDSAYLPLLSRAEKQSNRPARDVISMARTMSLNERTIIKGGCWDYLNAVFNRAGVNRSTVHKGIYAEGPYVNSGEIQVGDWLYYINHGYNDIEHSGLFVGWVDESAKQALILSYAGESRQEPARYRVYDLSHVYQIIRPT